MIDVGCASAGFNATGGWADSWRTLGVSLWRGPESLPNCPEARGDRKRTLGRPADVWGLGVVLFDLFQKVRLAASGPSQSLQTPKERRAMQELQASLAVSARLRAIANFDSTDAQLLEDTLRHLVGGKQDAAALQVVRDTAVNMARGVRAATGELGGIAPHERTVEQEHSFAVLDFLEKMLRMRASERWDCSELMRHWLFTKFLGREGHDELLWANWGQVRPIRFAVEGESWYEDKRRRTPTD